VNPLQDLLKNRLSLAFQLDPLEGSLDDDRARLLDVVGNFQVIIDARSQISEPSVRVVELALRLSDWCEIVENAGVAFYYESLAPETPGLLKIVNGHDGWNLSSAVASFASADTFTLQEVIAACIDFIAQVESDVLETHGFSIRLLPRLPPLGPSAGRKYWR
jgi:hypothetical protein